MGFDAHPHSLATNATTNTPAGGGLLTGRILNIGRAMRDSSTRASIHRPQSPAGRVSRRPTGLYQDTDRVSPPPTRPAALRTLGRPKASSPSRRCNQPVQGTQSNLRSACMHPRPTFHSGAVAAPAADRKLPLQRFLPARLLAFRTGFRSRATLDPTTLRGSNSGISIPVPSQ